jgi:hypothetical protein
VANGKYVFYYGHIQGWVFSIEILVL